MITQKTMRDTVTTASLSIFAAVVAKYPANTADLLDTFKNLSPDSERIQLRRHQRYSCVNHFDKQH